MSVDYSNKIKGSFTRTRLFMDLIRHAATSTQGHIRVTESHIKFTFFFLKFHFYHSNSFILFYAFSSFLPVILSNRFAFSFERSVSVLYWVMWQRKKIFHCVESVRIWSFSGPYFPSFWLNTQSYSIFFSNLTLN